MTDTPSESLSQAALDEALFDCIRVEGGKYRPERLRTLLEAGANPNAIDKEHGVPVLHIAAVWHNLDATEALLDAGANPELKDGNGNTALHKALLPKISLRLMLAGASPTTFNEDFRQPQNEISLQNTSSSYHDILMQTKRLLEDCVQVEKAADRHALSDTFWESMWPQNAFGYPPPSSPVPHLLTLQYFLKKTEETGASLSKEFLFRTGSPGEGLCDYLARDGDNIEAWKRHCAYQSIPMTMDDWRNSEVVEYVHPDSAHLLFDTEEIVRLPTLQPLYAFYAKLPEKVREEPSTVLQKTLSNAIGQWLREGPGKDMPADTLRQLYRDMPDDLKPFVALQQELLNRPSPAATHAQGGKGR